MTLTEINTASQLNELMQDPWRVLVVDYETQRYWITSYGDGGEFKVLSKVNLSTLANKKLKELTDGGELFVSPINNDNCSFSTATCYFIDVFREGVYPKRKKASWIIKIRLFLLKKFNVFI